MAAMNNKLALIGYAFGLAGADRGTANGPLRLRDSMLLREANLPITWDSMLQESAIACEALRVDESVNIISLALAERVSTLLKQHQPFCVIGGDHTSAIGTWSGVHHVLHQQGDLGLIWIDAHMDSHTPETTESGRIHGMPLASLMGYGFPTMTGVKGFGPKVKPENVALIGVRSFERGEAALLERLNVRVYDMDEINQRGLEQVFEEAIDRIKDRTIGYGLSIDLDALDPDDAPGVDVPEAHGIRGDDFCRVLARLARDPRLIASEIAEFDPARDKDDITEKLVIQLLRILSR